MLWWDEEYLKLLESLSVDVGLYTRFKDDIGIVTEALSDEAQYSNKHKEFVYESNLFGKIFENFRGKTFKEIYDLRSQSKNEKNTMELYLVLQIPLSP